MTSDDIAAAAGVADCIGGVRTATRSFAIGQASADPNTEMGSGTRNKSAKIATHEIAHLLGAHHQYANCAEAPRDASGDLTMLIWEACTVLINDVGLASLGWSTLAAAVVRGHVAGFAVAAGQGPEPIHPRKLSLKITKKWVAKGDIISRVPECFSDLAVSIERRQSRRWIQVVSDEAFTTGNYEIEIPPSPGTYRAAVGPNHMVGPTHRETCAGATSAAVPR